MSVSKPCGRCPCKATCLRWDGFCGWAAKEPPDPVELAHICGRSALGITPDYPPLATQAGNLARSLWDWAISGFSTASDEEQARRLAICATCQHWDAGRCRLCGCNLVAEGASSRRPIAR